jgi:hypothetical protein
MDLGSKEERHLHRLSRHILSQLVCMGRHTLTNLLTTEGRQFVDWTADYRMYSKERIDWGAVFGQIREEVYALNKEKLLITALDDSLLRKISGRTPVKYIKLRPTILLRNCALISGKTLSLQPIYPTSSHNKILTEVS